MVTPGGRATVILSFSPPWILTDARADGHGAVRIRLRSSANFDSPGRNETCCEKFGLSFLSTSAQERIKKIFR